jgi:hypothetical protein
MDNVDILLLYAVQMGRGHCSRQSLLQAHHTNMRSKLRMYTHLKPYKSEIQLSSMHDDDHVVGMRLCL